MRKALIFLFVLAAVAGLSTQQPAATYVAQETANVFSNTNAFTLGIVTGNVGGTGNSDHVTGVLASSTSSQSANGEVVFSATVVWTPNALNPSIPFAAGFDEFIACGLGAANSVTTTNIAGCLGFSGNVVSTATAGKTVNVTDMANFVANPILKQGVGTINVTNNDGFWATNLGGQATNGYPFRCDDQSPSGTGSYCFYSAGRGINHFSDILQTNGQQHAVVAKTTTYLATKNDEVILADATGGPFTITLPVASTVQGSEFTIKKADVSANLVTLSSNGSFIDVGASYTGLTTLNNFVTVVSSGAGYYIKASGTQTTNTVDCGGTATCAGTQKQTGWVVRGSVPFPTATTVTVTGLPFGNSGSYSCTASDSTTAAGLINATTYASGASVTFTETGGVNTDIARYVCVGS